MLNVRYLAAGGILVCTAAIFQLIPGLFGEFFILFTIISGLPVFMAARLKRPLGFLAYLAAGLAVSLINIHEGLFFLVMNGLIGLSLGLPGKAIKSNYAAASVGAISTTAALFLLNYALGISILDLQAIKTPVAQFLTLFSFLFVYCIVYYRIALRLYRFVEKAVHFTP